MTTWQDGGYQKALTYDRSNQITATSSRYGDKEAND